MLALFGFNIRQLIGRHRWGMLSFWLLLTLLPALLAAVGLAFAGDGAQRLEMSLDLFNDLTLALILPVLALLVTSSLLREEIQNQTIVYLYMKPLGRARLVLSPFAAGTVVLSVLMALNVISVGATFQDGRVTVFLLIGAIAVLVYGAFFTMLSLFAGRVVLWGLGYLLLWEGFLANLSRPVSLLTIKKYLLSLEQRLLGDFSEVPLETALLVLLGVLIVSLGVAIWRLQEMEFPGDTES